MDKNIERVLQSPMMKLANENQARLDSLSLANGSTDKLLKIAQDLDPAKNWAGRIATQDLLSQFSQDFPESNLGVDKSIAGIITSLAESNSINKSLFESIKLNTALIDTFKATNLGLKPATQFILPKGFTSKNQIGDLSSIISEATEIFKQHKQFKQYSSFEILSNLNKDFFREILTTNLTPADIEDFSESSIAEIDAELSDEIKLEKDFSSYSEKAKKILYFFCTFILLPYLIGIASSLSVNYIQQFQEVSKTLETSREVKSFTRSSHLVVNRQTLKGYRVTTVNTLNFRDDFGMDSTIMDTIPIGTIMRVIDKSNKTWLLVEVEVDGELEQGWVLRRYTTYFR